MVRTTKAQRLALKRVFDRGPVYSHKAVEMGGLSYRMAMEMSYREFRRSVQPTFGCDGAIMVPWAGMWLGIEPDGYTHS